MSKLLIIYRGLAISKDFPYVPLGQGLSAKGRLSAKGKLSFLFVKYLFVYLFETIRERGKREREYSICCFSPQMATTAGSGLGWTQQCRAISESPSWVQGFQGLQSYFAAFLGTFVGGQIGSGAPRTQTNAHWSAGSWTHHVTAPAPDDIFMIYKFGSLSWREMKEMCVFVYILCVWERDRQRRNQWIN